MGDVNVIDEVLVRVVRLGAELPFQWRLVRGSDAARSLTAADALAILGDRVPVIGWDDSGAGGALMFPDSDMGCRLAKMLRDQLNDALQTAELPCPAESFPEPADFAEPPGGESARVEREEAAHLDALRAKALLAPDAVAHHRYAGWAPGDRFIVNDPDDVARFAAALHLWPTWGGKASGTVITRCDRHHDGHDTSAGLLIDCEGLPRPIVVSPRVLSACAKKVL
jgi:hypothetical protein